MRQVKGAMKGTGRVGDVVFSKRIGQKGTFAGIAGGPTATQIQTLPQFARTRENNSEFRGMQLFNKTLHDLIVAQISLGTDNANYMRKLLRKLKIIQKLNDTAVRGQRGILGVNFDEIMDNINLNTKRAFTSSYTGQFAATMAVGRNSAVISFATGISESVVAPSGATHVEMSAVMCCVGDVIFDAGTQSFVIDATAIHNGIKSSANSGKISIDTATPIPDLTTTFDGSPVMVTTESVFLVIVISFYQMIDATPYKMFGKDSALLIGRY